MERENLDARIDSRVKKMWDLGFVDEVEELINKNEPGYEIAKYVLSQSHWSDHPEWVEAIIRTKKLDW
jgi:tRNA A37 N6-isopentenylltransferase MiaA